MPVGGLMTRFVLPIELGHTSLGKEKTDREKTDVKTLVVKNNT